LQQIKQQLTRSTQSKRTIPHPAPRRVRPAKTAGAIVNHAETDAEDRQSGRQSVQTKLSVPRAQNKIPRNEGGFLRNYVP